MHNSIDIARYFVRLAKKSNIRITPLKLLMLVYVSNGYSLSILNAPLLKESIKTGKYGPVIQSLYNCLTLDHDDRILNTNGCDKLDREIKNLLINVWSKYKNLSGKQLCNLTNGKGTPWANCIENNHKIINNTIVKEHYGSLLKKITIMDASKKWIIFEKILKMISKMNYQHNMKMN
jgi:uncharacterized phage-associated protein